MQVSRYDTYDRMTSRPLLNTFELTIVPNYAQVAAETAPRPPGTLPRSPPPPHCYLHHPRHHPLPRLPFLPLAFLRSHEPRSIGPPRSLGLPGWTHLPIRISRLCATSRFDVRPGGTADGEINLCPILGERNSTYRIQISCAERSAIFQHFV
jgi:hypothetical protein